jgi:hypothetical protein
MPAIEQLAASFLARHYASLCDQAHAIHLGARAAALEGRPGGFDTPAKLISRIAEAGGTGTILQDFVGAARTVVIANTLFKGHTGAGVTDARDRAAQDLFDGSLRRLDAHDRLRGPVRPRAATMLDILGSELGVLPHPLQESIQRVLESKGGPR